MAEPLRSLPLSDLLEVLRRRGVSVGIREYYEVAWLLERWPDLDTLREALGAILGTDREEARIVRQTFDELYPGDWTDLGELKRVLVPVLAEHREEAVRIEETLERLHGDDRIELADPELREKAPPAGLLQTYWPGMVAAVAMASLIGWLILRPPLPPPPIESTIQPPPPASTETEDPAPPAQDRTSEAPEDVLGRRGTPDRVDSPVTQQESAELKESPPEPPPLKPRWSRSTAVGGLAALASFFWLYWRRTGREARRIGYQALETQPDNLDGPQTYRLDLGALEPPFDGGLLDDVAMLMSRQATVAEARAELEIDRTLDATLEAGLAPRLVFANRSAVEPVLVLEDVAAEMRPYRYQTAALLAGLRERGVYLEHWKFDGDADHLFMDTGPPIAIERLVRQRIASPLLILSTGSGIFGGDEPSRAPWVEQLDFWLSRAWLHPNPDPRTWRQAVKELSLPVWPLNAEGLTAASRHLATAESDETTLGPRLIRPPRPVTPLQVNRLRRLLDLSPRRDAGIAELLRQEFCPHVPPTAVVDAVAAPPLDFPPAIGPSDEEVRRFLIDVLDRSRPKERGSAADLRWQLDRALQGLHLESERDESLFALRELSEGPLAAEVALTVEPLAEADGDGLEPDVRRTLRGKVLVPIDAEAKRQAGAYEFRAQRRQWSRPTLLEVAVPLLLVGLVAATPALLGLFLKPADQRAMERLHAMTEPAKPKTMRRLLETAGIGGAVFDLSMDYAQVSLPTVKTREPIPGMPAIVSMTESGQIRVSSGEEISVPVPGSQNVLDFAATMVAEDPERAFALKIDRGIAYGYVDTLLDVLRQAKARRVYLLGEQEPADDLMSTLPPILPGGLPVHTTTSVRFKPPPPKQRQEIPETRSQRELIPTPSFEPEPVYRTEGRTRDAQQSVDQEAAIAEEIVEEPYQEPRAQETSASQEQVSAETTGPMRVTGDIVRPRPVRTPSPQYTEIARKARIQGVVIVEAIINKEGKVTNVKVLKGLPMGLSEAAVEAVKKWEYEPATLAGKPVEVYYNLTVNFQLQ